MFRFLRSNQNESMAVILKPQEAYLHIITGGYYNDKRREVRLLFAKGQLTDDVKDNKMDNIDIAVGILEEFHAINVPTFTLHQAIRVVYIFKLENLFTHPGDIKPKNQLESEVSDALERYFNNPRMQLSSSGEHAWKIPNETQINRLKIQFCKRDMDEIKAVLDDHVLQAVLIQDESSQGFLSGE